MFYKSWLLNICNHRFTCKTYQRCRRFSISSHLWNVRVRFAPSPTGFLHIGGLRTALLNYLFVKSQKGGGQFIIRIEDTDQSRIVPGVVENLLNQLKWAGITPDEGPGIGGDFGPYVQSERLDIYEKYANQLLDNGIAYKCFCSERRLEILRRDQMQRKERSRYDNRCRNLSESEIEEKLDLGMPYVLRLKLQNDIRSFEDILNGEIKHDVASIEGDPVIYKSDRYPTYHLANIVDDHLMKITHVLRGQEWMMSTVKHVMLYEAFGWKPPQYAHLPLLLNEDGRKLSKRQGDVYVEQYREGGYHAASILNFLAHYGAGFTESSGIIFGDEVATPTKVLDIMAKEFSMEKVGVNNSIVSFSKLGEYNSTILKHLLSDERSINCMIEELRKYVLEKYGESNILNKMSNDEQKNEYIDRVLSIRKNHITVLKDLISEEYNYVWIRPSIPHEEIQEDMMKFVLNICSFLEDINVDGLSKEVITPRIRDIQAKAKLKIAPAMTLLRYLLSGRKQGPAVAEIICILGKTESVARLKKIQQFHNKSPSLAKM
ncbi:nondiscriminating glutamyl-tRNA synthetase EARS2, mitochondrial-like [Styela clava]